MAPRGNTRKYVKTVQGCKYSFFVSDKAPKKYYALVGRRKVYFGDARYEQYKDKIGHYASQDHGDKKRREAYRNRHAHESLAPGTAGFFSWYVLW
jgi:hypothetical protein